MIHNNEKDYGNISVYAKNEDYHKIIRKNFWSLKNGYLIHIILIQKYLLIHHQFLKNN